MALARLAWPPPSALVGMKGSALATTSTVSVRTSEPPRLQPLSRLREIAGDREILANLVRKEVKVKYKSSVLGAAWSMLNPILYLAVFSLVFTVVLSNATPHFPVYLLSGLLAWNLFATALALGSRSVVDNSNLVTKVYFPREILPLASVGAAGVDFVLQGLVLVLFMAAFRYGFLGLNALLLPLSLVALVAFTSALTLPVAVPVLAPVSVGWLAILLGAVTSGSILLLVLAWRTFFHLSGDFAEEL